MASGKKRQQTAKIHKSENRHGDSAALQKAAIASQPLPLGETTYSKPIKSLASYDFDAEGVPVKINIVQHPQLFVPSYEVSIPAIGPGTQLVLEKMKADLVLGVPLDVSEIVDPKKAEEVKEKFKEKTISLIAKYIPTVDEETRNILSGYLIQQTLGLGELEIPLNDENLEEVCVNSTMEPIWVYHKKLGWLHTNITITDDAKVYNYATMIGRKVGRQINVLNPLMDAHLVSGDRVNATLAPISTNGNTITIRKFSKNPWTITHLIEYKTISAELAALVWLCIQYELSLVVAGGTGSGKTSMLNCFACFIQPTQRIISIEDTRELNLPSFLHWIPMTTREPNPEGKGGVEMLDLAVNALRQRPDRIIVGEIRRKREAEVLFEAMHTGHSVYATFHADNASEAISRLTNPPIDIPQSMLDAISAIIVQYRHRKLRIRRTLEFAEVVKTLKPDGGITAREHVTHRWNLKDDKINKIGELTSLAQTLNLYAGMTYREIQAELSEKQKVLDYLLKNGVKTTDEVGIIIAEYYRDQAGLMELVNRKVPWKETDLSKTIEELHAKLAETEAKRKAERKKPAA